jgi:hypothetical protein
MDREGEHLPGCDRRHGRRQRCNAPSPEVVGVEQRSPDRAPSTLYLRCLVLLLIAISPFLAVCGFLGAVLVLDRAPELPNFARPMEAQQLHNDSSDCIRTENFGPYRRQIAFGTDRSWVDVKSDLVDEFDRLFLIKRYKDYLSVVV